MSKNLSFKSEARAALKRGVDQLADAVQVTLGPKGRNVLIEKAYGGHLITKDGVTVAREVKLPNKQEMLGADVVREAAQRTNDVAGDGTTTATVLAREIFNAGLLAVDAGANPLALKRGIEKAAALVIQTIKEKAQPVKPEDIARIASISANSPEIGQKISDMLKEMGNDGIITVEDGRSLGIETEVVKGMRFEKGYMSPYMVTNPEKMEAELRDVFVFVTDARIGNAQELAGIMDKAAQASSTRVLFIICEDMQGEALGTSIINTVKGIFHTVVVRAPDFGDTKTEILRDICALSGATFVSVDAGRKLDSVTAEDFGRFDKVIVTKENTTLVGGKGKQGDVDVRIAGIKTAYEKAESKFDKDRLTTRLAKLTGGVGVMKVGAATEVEMKEKRHRVEDAVNATRAAVEEGIVPGGGTMLIRAGGGEELQKIIDAAGPDSKRNDESTGFVLLLGAVCRPLELIAENAGFNAGEALKKVSESDNLNYGFNAETGEYGDLVEMGVIDPAKVTRVALENAVSVACMLLTTECVITDIPEEKKEPGHPQG